jgi:hypothetical protein
MADISASLFFVKLYLFCEGEELGGGVDEHGVFQRIESGGVESSGVI